LRHHLENVFRRKLVYRGSGRAVAHDNNELLRLGIPGYRKLAVRIADAVEKTHRHGRLLEGFVSRLACSRRTRCRSGAVDGAHVHDKAVSFLTNHIGGFHERSNYFLTAVFLMTTNRIRLIILGLSCVPFAAAQQQLPVSVRQRMEASVSRQTAAAQAMESSIERQKAALQRRTGGPAEAFFDMQGPSGVAGGPPPVCDPLPAPQIESLIETASLRQGVDADLIRDVMKEESAFKPCAVSPKGAMGLMQLMPMTAGDLGVSNPFDPEENVNAGTQFLKRLMLRYGGDLALTLGAYNAGPSRVERAAKIAVPEMPETVNYVRDILSLFIGQKRLLESTPEPPPDDDAAY
jgi:hypothetical protein